MGRRIGIGAGVVQKLGADGFDVAFTYWRPYDSRMPWGRDDDTVAALRASLAERAVRCLALEADLEEPAAVQEVFDSVEAALGPVSTLVLCHCESVDSGLLDTTIESFDRHFAVNARASWLAVREFATRFRAPRGCGRIVALTSDHTVGNVPYGSSKGALDRIVLAAARELAPLGVTANVVDPGATDTGWMSSELKEEVVRRTPAGRVGRPADAANLVSFLCSDAGGWINGQLLHSDGGASAP